jgi:tetratricopeptide (TPR) repeat protein
VSDKNEKTGGKNLTDDLLEGFDDAFDDELDQALERSQDVDPLGTSAEPSGFVDQGSSEKTEFFQKDADKTEFFAKENVNERTQVVMTNDDNASLDLEPDSSVEQPQDSVSMKVPTEDLLSLVEEESSVLEVQTEDPLAIESTRNAKLPPRVPTEDLAGLVPDEAFGEGRTEHIEIKTEDLSSMIDSDLLEPSIPSKKNQNVNASDLSSLIEQQINSEEEGKTEDFSSMIQSNIVEPRSENINPLDLVSAHPEKKFPDPPRVVSKSSSRKELSKAPDPIPAAEDSLSYSKSEASKTVRMITKKQKIMMGAGIGVGALVIVGGLGYFFMKPKVVETVVTTEAPAQPAQPIKVIESEELLRELEEKYQQAQQYFITDRFQSYTEATNKLEEILSTYPNHKKANARLAEAILLKFDGYLDSERKNRMYQLIEKAESLDANSVETLRAKARLLMFEGKLSDATVRVQQALSVGVNDYESIQTQGEILFESKNYKNALISFSQAMKLQPNAVRSKYFYYLTKAEQGAFKEAEIGFANLSADMNTHPKSNIEKFAMSMRKGSLDKAKTDLENYLNEKDKDLSPSEAAQGWKIIADIHLKQSNTQGAVEALEKAVSKMALNHQFTYQLGNLYFQQKNFDKASQHYSTSVTLDPENISYLTQLGISLRQQGRLKEAEEQLKKVTTKAPKDFEGLYQYAYTKYKLGYADEVVTQLNLNIKENPQFLQGKVLLGIIQMEKNDFKSSLENFQQVLKLSKDRKVTQMATIAMGDFYMMQEQWNKARIYYAQANSKEPNSYDIHFALAKIDIHLGSVTEAQNHLHQMQKINPASVEAKVLQGGILVKQNNYDKAIEVYRDVLKSKEDDYQTRIELAKVFIEEEKYSDAMGELLMAYKYNADYFNTYLYIGIAARGIGDLAESERNLQKAIQLLPKFFKAHYELGVTFLRKDDVKRGEESMKAALAINPTYMPALTGMGDYFYGSSSFAEASVYYQKALEAQPGEPELMLKLGKTYHEMASEKKASALFQKIIQLNPKSSSIFYELGVLFEENTDIPQALRMYQKSIALDRKNPKPHYQLGFLYKELGQNAKAVASFRTFLALNPSTIEKADIEDQIQKLSGKK